MRHEEQLDRNCAIARTGAMLGERWVFAILRAAYFRARTFEDYAAATGIARNVLADRLKRLVEYGILEKRPYEQTASRTRSEYRLTDAGLDLYPVIVGLMRWAGRHLADGEDMSALELIHRGCGAPADPYLACSNCHEPITGRDIEARVRA